MSNETTLARSSLEDLPSRLKTKSLYTQYRPQYEMALARISRQVRRLLIRNRLNALMRIRVKTFDSFFNKVLRFYNEGRREDLAVTDFIGIRIICSFLGDIEQVQHLLQQNFKIIETEQKGAHYALGEFGYDSLHLLIELPEGMILNPIPYTKQTCEIQVRTKLQDAWAEVEHELIYKADYSVLNDSIRRKLAMLNASLKLSDMIFQEIRDYQRMRRAKEEKRRADLLSMMEASQAVNPFINGEETEKAAPQPTINPSSLSLDRLLFQALDAHSRHDYPLAINLYTRILERSTDRKIKSVIYNHRGMAYFVLGEYRQAVNDFTRAVQLNPQNFRAYNSRGLCFRMMKQYERALEDFESSLEIDAMQTDAYFGRAQLYFDLCDYPRALDDCLKVLNIKPDFKPAQRFQKLIQAKLFSEKSE